MSENTEYTAFIQFFKFLLDKNYKIVERRVYDSYRNTILDDNHKFDYDNLVNYFKIMSDPCDFVIYDSENTEIGSLMYYPTVSLNRCHIRGNWSKMNELYTAFVFFQSIDYFGDIEKTVVSNADR